MLDCNAYHLLFFNIVNAPILNTHLILLCGLVTLSAIPTQAAYFNIDFGGERGTPDIGYGAASGQTGTWNTITVSGPTILLDSSGSSTTTSLSCTGVVFTGAFGTNNAFLGDNFYSEAPTAWNVSITGLANGTYSIYYYAPANPIVGTGNFLVNGTPVLSIPGRSDDVLEQGVSWDVINNVSVTSGTLSLTYTGGGLAYNGLAGMQIVPEPAPYAILFFGICGLTALIRSYRH